MSETVEVPTTKIYLLRAQMYFRKYFLYCKSEKLQICSVLDFVEAQFSEKKIFYFQNYSVRKKCSYDQGNLFAKFLRSPEQSK